MYSTVNTCVLQGLDGTLIEAETDLANGLPAFSIVGLPDASIKESKERVRAAITNSGFKFPVQRITINLAPANLRKEGSQLDLSIAVGILVANGNIVSQVDEDTVFLGELALDGRVIAVDGLLPMLLSLQEAGMKRCIIPQANSEEASLVKGLELIPVANLRDLVAYLNEERPIEPVAFSDGKFLEGLDDYSIDFSEMKGQESLKRAMEIAAAGEHNLLMIGPPGSGKTMAAMRLATILPSLSFEESLESTKIYSAAGELKDQQLIARRPFRDPHHTSSSVSLIGGGRIPKPGEISLAHNGCLFLDELPEFPKSTIEVLRQPLEEKQITIARANASLTYPANFLFIAGMNPCPCGYHGDPYHDCTCSMTQITNYLNKVSRPILDRIDIVIEVQPVKITDLQEGAPSSDSASIRQRVEAARKIQGQRFVQDPIRTNGQMKNREIKKYLQLGPAEEKLMAQAFDRYRFSARTYHKILKLARTIADLEAAEKIENKHLLEAIRYRTVIHKYWG